MSSAILLVNRYISWFGGCIKVIKRTFKIFNDLGGHMGIYFRSFGAAMAQQFLYITYIGSLFQHVGGKAMP